MTLEELKEKMDPSRYVGRAPEQTEEFLQEVVKPALEPFRNDIGLKAEINV